MSIKFLITSKIKGGLGRAGVLETLHGAIDTPAFIPVGTKGTVKGITPKVLEEIGVQGILANAYHLYLQPGTEVIAKAGGIHKFMNWSGPVITDSGGFQVFSLGAAFGKGISKVVAEKDPSKLIPERSISDPVAPLAKVGADGVSFKSHLDGSVHYFTPEKSVEIQHAIGADIIFAFDECTSPTEDKRYQEEALGRTHRWAERSFDYHQKSGRAERQALFGVVQGGRIEELRRKSARKTAEIDFVGFGIGGSFEKKDLHSAVRWVNEELPEDRPRHLLGIGEPEDLILGVENGVDLFDCVAPTRNGRTGTLYTRNGKINIENAKFKADQGPVDKHCDCYACCHFTRSYLHHLYSANEMLGPMLGSTHNTRFITKLMEEMRQSIINGTFADFKYQFLLSYKQAQ